MAVMSHDGVGAGGWLIMSFMMLLFWAVVIGCLVWMLRGRSSEPPRPTDPNRARQILDERYARGEIGDEEYRQRCELLHTG